MLGAVRQILEEVFNSISCLLMVDDRVCSKCDQVLWNNRIVLVRDKHEKVAESEIFLA